MTDSEEQPKYDAMLFRGTGLTVTEYGDFVAIHHPQLSVDLGLTPSNARLLDEALLESA